MGRIEQALQRQFEKHRIVFWYDAQQELRAEFDAVALPGVAKVVVAGNAFGLKYRLLRAEPERRFLLYLPGPPPADLDNWLLDVELAHGRFSADRMALWLSELELDLRFASDLAAQQAFLQSERRRAELGALLRPGDSVRQVRLKMLAVCAGATARLDAVLEALLTELAGERDDKIRLIQRCGLEPFLWEQTAQRYGYQSPSPSVRDFALALFEACYRMDLGEEAALTNDAVVFLQRWQTSVHHRDAFSRLSDYAAGVLRIQDDLLARPYRQLVAGDAFELIDRKILSELARDVADRSVTATECARIVRQRRQTHWFDQFAHPYEALRLAAAFLETLEKSTLTVRSLSEGVTHYAASWYLLDQMVRQFHYHARVSGQTTLLEAVAQQVENHYTNSFLLPLNDAWQVHVDAADRWAIPPHRMQADFHAIEVANYLKQGKKVSVIISDALRYECGAELLQRIRGEDRYDAELSPMVSVLPSYTQLGMAALLPHARLTLDGAGQVLADGQPTQGLAARSKILAAAHDGRATAVRAEDLMGMNRDESRALIRDHDLVYVYHNVIDARGDKRDTEQQVFVAAEEALEALIMLIKKLANANANNLLVTADHGFLYQDGVDGRVHESDFVENRASGERIVQRNRRFVLGEGLAENRSFKRFTAVAAGLDGPLDMLIPKSINRLRVQGAGSRYVHGGAALQEVVVPLIRINKKRESDLGKVEVDIVQGTSRAITTGQVTATFYQTTPVSPKVQPRVLRAGIYAQSGELISDQHELTFDIQAESVREREMKVRFVLTSQADAFNDQDVFLRLEEREPDTSRFVVYGSVSYVLRRRFTSDFDF